MNDHATTQVRAVASREAEQLKGWLNTNKSAGAQIEQFQKDPRKLELTTPAEPPHGPPIGDDEDFVAFPS